MSSTFCRSTKSPSGEETWYRPACRPGMIESNVVCTMWNCTPSSLPSAWYRPGSSPVIVPLESTSYGGNTVTATVSVLPRHAAGTSRASGASAGTLAAAGDAVPPGAELALEPELELEPQPATRPTARQAAETASSSPPGRRCVCLRIAGVLSLSPYAVRAYAVRAWVTDFVNSSAASRRKPGSVSRSAPVLASAPAALSIIWPAAGVAAASRIATEWPGVPSGAIRMYGWMHGSRWLTFPMSELPAGSSGDGSLTSTPTAARYLAIRLAIVWLLLRSSYRGVGSVISTAVPVASAAARAQSATRAASATTPSVLG